MNSRGFYVGLSKEDKPEILSEQGLLDDLPERIDYVDYYDSKIEDDVEDLGFDFRKLKNCYEINIGEDGIKKFKEWHKEQVRLRYNAFMKKPTSMNSYKLAEVAYPDAGYLFIETIGTIMNEVRFISWLEWNKANKFYVFKTFYYHYF